MNKLLGNQNSLQFLKQKRNKTTKIYILGVYSRISISLTFLYTIFCLILSVQQTGYCVQSEFWVGSVILVYLIALFHSSEHHIYVKELLSPSACFFLPSLMCLSLLHSSILPLFWEYLLFHYPTSTLSPLMVFKECKTMVPDSLSISSVKSTKNSVRL